MSNTEKQESVVDNNDTTETRLSFADKAEKLLRTILVALGYENVGALRGEDLITSITAWVTLLIRTKREPGGSYASFWARAFLDAWRDMPSVEAAESATAAVNEFAKRYPPMLDDVLIDEQERATQSDIQSAMSELDKQTQLVWQLESELVAIRKLNEHHASEVRDMRFAKERTERELHISRTNFDNFKKSVCERLGNVELPSVYEILELHAKSHNALTNGSALVPLAKPERVEPGQRWAFVMRVEDLYDCKETGVRISFDNSNLTRPDQDLKTDEDWLYLGKQWPT